MHDTFSYKEVPHLTEPHTIQENAIITTLVANKTNYLLGKRVFDVVCSLLVILLVLTWMLPLVALCITLGSRGPVFFSQIRVGRHGRLFRCLKFRSMEVNSLADEKPAEPTDPRITRVGRFLRRTNLDEFPQFFNVLAGSMSVIGPRPHMVADCERFSFVISSYPFRTRVKPGITGLAQVKGYHGPAMEYEGIVNRYYWDAAYVRKASIALDFKILAKTITIGFRNLLGALRSEKMQGE